MVRDYIIGPRKKKTRRDLDIASMQEIIDNVFLRKRTYKEAALAQQVTAATVGKLVKKYKESPDFL